MSFRLLLSFGIAAALAATVVAQDKPAPSAKGTPKKYTVPRTADGHPDLQGNWTNATLTPLQRLPQFAEKPTISEAEATKFEKAQTDNTYADKRSNNAEQDRDHAYNALFFDRGTQLARVDGQARTSLIIDPADGHVPPRADGRGALGRGGRGGGRGRGAAGAPGANAAPEAAEEGSARTAGIGRFDSVKDRPLGERCLLGFGSTSGPPMMPVLYNNNYQIVQTPDAVMIMVEMVHDVRMVRMNAQHLPNTMRKWLGDSVGHWDGDTLVVDTTNFTTKTHYQGATDNLHVIERFTRVDDHTILYKFTVEDPATWTRPWTAEYPFLATNEHIYEYACHEGNYAMPDILGGARKDDAAKK